MTRKTRLARASEHVLRAIFASLRLCASFVSSPNPSWLSFPLSAAKICFAWIPFVMANAAWADLATDEESAIRAAVERAAPAIVRIETVGGLDQVAGKLFGAGPTTGLVVEPEGWIISSAYNFLHKPSSILVRLPDGARRPARWVATDHARMLVLLKIETERPLPVCEAAPRGELRPGQWTIAVGRAMESDRPTVAIGVLSAVNRVWGRAIQTDAAVSPNNYGGPLLDIRGRVLGVLSPLSPSGAGALAGAEWYDSGIGFAVPIEDVLRALPRLKKGEDLLPAQAGFRLKGMNVYTSDPILSECVANGPAAKAGLRAGDRIIELDGRPIARAAEVREALGRRYAGDTLPFAALRGSERIEGEMRLTAAAPEKDEPRDPAELLK